MKERIDDLFRDNIDNRSFDYQDELWGDIAAELDARDKKKKRPFFWVLAGVALPIFIAAGAYYFAPFGENGLVQTKVTQLVFEDKKAIEAEIKETVSDQIKNINSSLTSSKIIEKNEKQSNEKTIPESKIPQAKTDNFSTKNIDKKVIINPKNNAPAFAENDKIPTQIQAHKTPQTIDNQLIKTVSIAELSTENVDNSLLNSKKFNEAEKIVLTENVLVEKSNSLTEEIESEEVIRTPIEEFPFLEKTAFFKTEEEEKEKSNFTKQIIPVSKTFNAFWTLGLIGTGGIDNQENQFSNWSTGVFADYRFAKKWSVDAAILYGEFAGNFGDTNSSLQTNYSFGRSRQMQKLKAEKLSLISLPITLNLHQKRHQFGLGIQTDYVLAVHGQKEVFEEEKMIFARVSSQSGVLTKPTEIPGLNFAGTASYQYNFTHFSIGARGRYYLKNYLPTPDLTVLPKDLMMFDLILKVNLK